MRRILFKVGGRGPRLRALVALVVGLSGLGCQSETPVAFSATGVSAETGEALRYPAFLADPTTAGRYRQEGLNSRQDGDMAGAITALKIAAALDPQNPDSHIILGWTQHLAGNRAAAAKTLQTALRQDREFVPALNALGIVYLVDGQLDAAVATHTRAADLKPDNEIAHYNLSLAYERLEQFDQAISHARTATELEPGNPHPWVALALAQWSQGSQAEAEVNYRQAMRLDGRYANPEYLNHLEQAGFSQAQVQTTLDLLRAID